MAKRDHIYLVPRRSLANITMQGFRRVHLPVRKNLHVVGWVEARNPTRDMLLVVGAGLVGFQERQPNLRLHGLRYRLRYDLGWL